MWLDEMLVQLDEPIHRGVGPHSWDRNRVARI